MKRIWIVAMVLIGVGALMIGAALVISGGKAEAFESKNTNFVEKNYTCEGDITALRVEETSGGVRIVPGDVNHVTVHYFDKKNAALYTVTEDNGELMVARTDERLGNFFTFSLEDHTTIITVPREDVLDMNLTCSSGGMTVRDLEVKSVHARMSSGGLRIENVTAKKDIDLEGSSGGITLENVYAGTALSAKLTSGGIKFDGVDAGEELTFRASSGGIRGEIAGKEEDYDVDASVGSGGSNLTSTRGNDREKLLTVSVRSGGVNITFED